MNYRPSHVVRVACILSAILEVACASSRSKAERVSARQMPPCAQAGTASVGYSGCSAIGVAMGIIKDIDLGSTSVDAEGRRYTTGNPMVLLDVKTSFPFELQPSEVFQLAVIARPPFAAKPVEVGNQVLITFVRADSKGQRSCGRLRSCDDQTSPVYVGLDVYAPTRWPN